MSNLFGSDPNSIAQKANSFAAALIEFVFSRNSIIKGANSFTEKGALVHPWGQ